MASSFAWYIFLDKKKQSYEMLILLRTIKRFFTYKFNLPLTKPKKKKPNSGKGCALCDPNSTVKCGQIEELTGGRTVLLNQINVDEYISGYANKSA